MKTCARRSAPLKLIRCLLCLSFLVNAGQPAFAAWGSVTSTTAGPVTASANGQTLALSGSGTISGVSSGAVSTGGFSGLTLTVGTGRTIAQSNGISTGVAIAASSGQISLLTNKGIISSSITNSATAYAISIGATTATSIVNDGAGGSSSNNYGQIYTSASTGSSGGRAPAINVNDGGSASNVTITNKNGGNSGSIYWGLIRGGAGTSAGAAIRLTATSAGTLYAVNNYDNSYICSGVCSSVPVAASIDLTGMSAAASATISNGYTSASGGTTGGANSIMNGAIKAATGVNSAVVTVNMAGGVIGSRISSGDTIDLGGNAASTLNMSGGTIQTDLHLRGQSVNLSGGAINGKIYDTSGFPATTSVVVSGDSTVGTIGSGGALGGISVQSGTMTVTGTTYNAGATTIGNGAVLNLASSNAITFGASSSFLLGSTGELALTGGGGATTGAIDGNGGAGGTFSISSAATVTLGAAIGGANLLGAVNVSGGATLNTGSYNVSSNVINVGGADGATLNVGAATVSTVTLNAGGVLNINSGSASLAGVAGGSNGAGIVNVGTSWTSGGALGTAPASLSALNVSNGATLTSANGVSANTITLGNDSVGNGIAAVILTGGGLNANTIDAYSATRQADLILNEATDLSISAAIGGLGSGLGVTQEGSGSTTLSGANAYTGSTTVNAGTLQAGTATNAFGNGSAVVMGNVAGAKLDLNNFSQTIGSLSGGGTSGGDVTLGNATLTAGSNNASTTYAGAISGTGGLTKTGTGTLTLSGANAYTGATTVNAGTLQAGAATNAFGNGGAVVLADVAGAALALNDFSQTIGSLSGGGANGGNVALGNATLTTGSDNANTTYAGAISGTGGLTKIGTGMLTLSGDSSYTGGTAVNAGTLNLASDTGLGAGTLALADGAVFQAGAASVNAANSVLLSSGNVTIDTNGNHLSLSGALSGGAAVTKDGSGTLSLTGSTMYSGGTAVNAGTLEFVQTADVAYGGDISGAGAVSVGATGHTVTLSGANTYTGGTTINAGTLAVGADVALGGAGGVALSASTLRAGASFATARAFTLSGGSTFDTNGNALTLSGPVDGTGGLTASGGGTLTLGAANTYTGGTTVAGGTTLSVGSDAALGDAGGGLTLNAATLKSSAALSTARAIVLSGAGTFDTNGFDWSLTGGVNGANALTKTGAGVLTLGGVNGYTGITTVAQGTLNLAGSLAGAATINAGAGLTGGGTINGNLLNSGSVSPTGVLTVNGDFTALGTSTMTIRSASDTLSVSGTSSLAGVLAVAVKPRNGTIFTVLTSTGGITGTFASIMGLTGITIIPTYTATMLQLLFTTSSTFASTPGLTPKQASLARAFDRASESGGVELTAAIAKLSALTPENLALALNQMGPSSSGALGGMSFAGSGVHSGAIGQRLAGLRTGGAAGAQSAYFVTNEQNYHGLLLAAPPGDTERYPAKHAPSRWGVFVSGLGTFGRLDARTDANGTTPGYGFTTGGVATGVDYRFGDGLIGGLTAGFTNNTATLDASGGVVTGRALRYGAYGTVYNDVAHGTLYLGGATDSYDSTRNIAPLGLAATSKPEAQELNVDATVGLDPDWALADAKLSPFAGLAYDRVATGGFTESGAGALNLTVAPFTAESLRSTFGLSLGGKTKVFGRALSSFVSAAWRHEYQNQSRAIAAQFSTGGSFSTQTADVERDGALVSTGLEAELGRGWSSKFGYTGDFRSGFWSHTVNGDLRLRF